MQQSNPHPAAEPAVAADELQNRVPKERFAQWPRPAVSDTTLLCVERDQLTLQFNTSEGGSFDVGTPTIPIAHAEAAPLVKGTALEPFFR